MRLTHFALGLLSAFIVSGAVFSADESIDTPADKIAGEPAEIQLKGTIALWSRIPCQDDVECLPKPLDITWPLQLTLKKPAATGATVVAERDLDNGAWKVHMEWVWVTPTDGQTSYLVTQSRLSHTDHGIITECTRYDSIKAFPFFPPGSCAGRILDKIFGVTFSGSIPGSTPGSIPGSTPGSTPGPTPSPTPGPVKKS
jgi:hypothetical protein